MRDAIPTYVQQEIRRCIRAIGEAQRRLRTERVALQRLNLKRRIVAQRRRMLELERRKVT